MIENIVPVMKKQNPNNLRNPVLVKSKQGTKILNPVLNRPQSEII